MYTFMNVYTTDEEEADAHGGPGGVSGGRN